MIRRRVHRFFFPEGITVGIVCLLVGGEPLLSQASRPSAEEMEKEWKTYALFQKNELLNFSDFLFGEGYFERAILASFRFIFLYPEDELIPQVYYRIARCYEESGVLDLAIEYFGRVQDEVGPASREYLSAQQRIAYIQLMKGNYQAVHELAINGNDPYLTVFDGYASMSELKWEEARESFLKVGRGSALDHHDRMLRRLVRACQGAHSIPKRKGTTTGLWGIFPGGGRIYQEDWSGAAGTLVSVGGLGLQLLFRGSSSFSLWIPGAALAALYGGSVVGSIRDVEHANERLLQRYARGVKAKLGPESFLDFPEPGNLSRGPGG